jgi:hypothetical protein
MLSNLDKGHVKGPKIKACKGVEGGGCDSIDSKTTFQIVRVLK